MSKLCIFKSVKPVSLETFGKWFVLTVIVMPMSVVAQSAVSTPRGTQASPYMTDYEFVTAKIKEQASLIRAAAQARLSHKYPTLSTGRIEYGRTGGNRRAEARVNEAIVNSLSSLPGIRFLRTTGGGPGKSHIFSVNWELAGTFTSGPENSLNFEIVEGEPQFIGSQVITPPTEFPNYQWNCSDKTVPFNVRQSHDKTDKTTNTITTERKSERTVDTKIENETGGKALINKASAAFKEVVTRRLEETNFISRETTHRREMTYTVEIPPNSVIDFGHRTRTDQQTWSYVGVARYDLPIVVTFQPSTAWNLPIGRWSEFVEAKDRELPLRSIANIVITTASEDISAPLIFANIADCRAAREQLRLTGTLPKTGPQPQEKAEPSRPIQLGINTLPDLQSISSLASRISSGSCEADVRSKGSMSGRELTVEHELKIMSCPLLDYQSTGRISFSAKVRSTDGREETLRNFESRWKNERGQNFILTDVENFGTDGYQNPVRITDQRVIDCVCTEK